MKAANKKDVKAEHERKTPAQERFTETNRREQERIIQELLRAQELNKLQLTRLQLMAKASKIGLWDMDVAKEDPVSLANHVSYSYEFRHMLGFTGEADFPSLLNSWYGRLHPEDQQSALDAFTKHLLDATGKTPFDAEYRLMKKNGEYTYYRATGETIRDRDGSPIRAAGALMDITETKKLLFALHNTAARLNAAIANYSGVIWSVDKEGVITLFNGLYLEKIGVTPSFLEGKNLEVARQKGRHLDIIENVEKTFVEGPQAWISEIEGRKFHARTTPIYDERGKISGVVGNIDDLTEMIALQEQLEKAMNEAKEASKAKSAFLSTMSHEIRTPLNAIIGMTAIAESAKDIKRKDYAIGKIKDASKHLLGVINDVLDMSKIEAEKFELTPVSFDFRKMLRNVADVINFRVDERRQKLHIHIAENIPETLIGDDQRLSQVIANLLSNAVKFTPEEGTIDLASRLLSEEGRLCRLQISVADTGIGITREQKERLFQAFEQAETETSRKFGGTGLGLAISKHIVDLMDGDIWVESEFGKGSTFLFTVLLERDAAQKKRLPDESAAGEPADCADDFTGYSVLLAEDIEVNREIVQALLEPTGLRIECAENGAQALAMFKAAPGRYCIIFMDVQMPEMDGYEATRRIRALGNPEAKTVPIIAMTANVFREDVEKCLEAGMNGHVGKPLEFSDILNQLRRYLPMPK